MVEKDSLRNKDKAASEEEIRTFRRAVGTLGWVVSVSRPEYAFAFSVLGSVQSKPKMSDFIRYAKAVKEMKSTVMSQMVIKKLNVSNLRLVVYSDASLGNVQDASSQIGYLIFLVDGHNSAVLVSWASKKSKRVARSTLTAETLAATEAIDNAVVMKESIEEILKIQLPPIILRTDNKSLHDAIRTTNTLSEKRLMIDMSALRQMSDRKEVEVQWISAKLQLADVLTKDGADKRKLMQIMSMGKLDMTD